MLCQLRVVGGQGTNRGDGALLAWAGSRVEVRPVRHLPTAPGWLDRPWAAEPGGIFVVAEMSGPVRIYDAVTEATPLLEDALGVDADDPAEVLRFVQRRGLIGAARPAAVTLPEGRPGFLWVDGVQATQRALREVQQLGRCLATIHRISELSNAPYAPGGKRPHALRVDFAVALNQALARPAASGVEIRLYPRLGFVGEDVLPPGESVTWVLGDRRPTWFPVLKVPTVYDVLLVELWRRAIDPRQRLRQCRECHRLFTVPKTRDHQFYCDDACRFALRERERNAARRKGALYRNAVPRRSRTNRGDVSLLAWGGCRIEVRPVRHLLTAPASLDRPWAADPGGVFVAEMSEPVRIYDALREAVHLLEDVSAVDVDDVEDVLRFVQRWGLIGAADTLAIPQVEGRSGFLWADGTQATQLALRQVQQLGWWLAAIQSRRWRSPELPDARHVRARKLPHALRVGFTVALNQALARPWAPGADIRLYPRLGLVGEDVLPAGESVTWLPEERPPADTWFPVLKMPTVYDVLLVELWRRAIDPRQWLRRCQQCPQLFLVSKTRHNKVFCSDACRFAFREQRRTAARRRKTARDRGQPVRCGLAPAG